MEKLMVTLLLLLTLFLLAINKKYDFLILYLILIIICYSLYRYGKREGFQNYSPINYGIGPYSNIVLKPKGCSNWRHSPANLPLIDVKKVYYGNQLPLKKQKNIRFDNIDAPNVDGTPNSPKSLFMFSNNICHPDCCPSTYSCDKGCVCTNEKQRRFINSRGTPNITEHSL